MLRVRLNNRLNQLLGLTTYLHFQPIMSFVAKYG
jgi:hypothetical protein